MVNRIACMSITPFTFFGIDVYNSHILLFEPTWRAKKTHTIEEEKKIAHQINNEKNNNTIGNGSGRSSADRVYDLHYTYDQQCDFRA